MHGVFFGFRVDIKCREFTGIGRICELGDADAHERVSGGYRGGPL